MREWQLHYAKEPTTSLPARKYCGFLGYPARLNRFIWSLVYICRLAQAMEIMIYASLADRSMEFSVSYLEMCEYVFDYALYKASKWLPSADRWIKRSDDLYTNIVRVEKPTADLYNSQFNNQQVVPEVPLYLKCNLVIML